MSIQIPQFPTSSYRSSSPSASSTPVVQLTTAQRMIALTTSATPSVMQNTSNTKRPKLSLQTAALPIAFGTSSTGLARTCTTASPTIRNTFNNAYEVTRSLSAIESPSPGRSFSKGSRNASPYPFNSHHYRTSDVAPYQQPLGLRSILRNSPLIRMSVPRHSVSISAGAIPENRRVFFPAKKQVAFRSHLEEEIRTVRYVARHSDLDLDTEPELEPEIEDESTSDSTDSQSDDHSSSEDDREVKDRSSPRKRRKSIPSERQIRAAAVRDGLDGDHYTASLTEPIRSKRRCKWRWTLDDSTASTETGIDSQSPLVLHSLQPSQPTVLSPSGPEKQA